MFPIMMLYLALILLRPQDYPTLEAVQWLPLQPALLLTATGLWAVSGNKSFEAPQYPLLLAFLAMTVASVMLNGWWGGAWAQFTLFAPTVLAFVVMAHAIDSHARLSFAMVVIVLCSAVLAVHGIDQAAAGIGWTGVGLSQGTRIQYVGIFNDPNDLGMLFVTALPMALYLAGRGGWLGMARLFWWAIAGTLLYGIVLTDSRGTMLALVAMVGVYVWLRRGPWTALALCAAGLAVMKALPSRMQELDVSEASALGRVDSWYQGLEFFRSSPLWGIGTNLYTDVFNLTAHNSYVLVLAENGVIGFTLWLAVIVYSFRMLLAVLRPSPAAEDEMEQEEEDLDTLHAQWGAGAVAAAGLAMPAGLRADAQAMQAAGVGTVDDGAHGDDVGAADVDAEPSEAQLAEAREERRLAMTLMMAMTGFFTAAFFLSRSYVITLYLLVAIIVAWYRITSARHPSLPRFRFSSDLLYWPFAVLGVVIGLHILVKLLLMMAA